MKKKKKFDHFLSAPKSPPNATRGRVKPAHKFHVVAVWNLQIRSLSYRKMVTTIRANFSLKESHVSQMQNSKASKQGKTFGSVRGSSNIFIPVFAKLGYEKGRIHPFVLPALNVK